METVCRGKQWDVLLAERKDGAVEGALPYLYGSKYGIRYILQPELTQFSGPWYNADDDDLDFQMRVGGDLVAQLEALGIRAYIQHFSPSITNWLPFYWKGYRQTTRYTYRFPSLANPDELFRKASRVRRRHMDEVAAACTVDTGLSPEEFAVFHKDYYLRRGGHDFTPQGLILNVCHAALARQQGVLWGLRSHDDRLQAGWFVAYDDNCGYSLLLAIGPDAPPNAMTYLMWQVLRHLSPLTRAFDFEGSMEPGTELFYRTFSTVQTPFFEVTKFRPGLLRMAFPV